MRIRYTAALSLSLSLLLAVTFGCKKPESQSQTAPPASTTAGDAPAVATVTEDTSTGTASVPPTVGIADCLASNQISIFPPPRPPVVGDTCLKLNATSSNTITWQADASAPTTRFKVQWAGIYPTGANYPYSMACSANFATTCPSGPINGGLIDSVAYYKVTLETGPQLYGRIIIRP